MAGGMHSHPDQAAATLDRLRADNADAPAAASASVAQAHDLEPGSHRIVRRPHVWVTLRDPHSPGIVLEQARSATTGEWLARVSWVDLDPQQPDAPIHHLEWLPAAAVAPA